MTTDPTPPAAGEEQAETTAPEPEPGSPAPRRGPRVTRISAAWVATAVALVLLVLLIVFILENSTKVEIQFLGMSGTIPVGMALLIAAVGGGGVVAVAGIARVTQLRLSARRTRRRASRAE
jgi:uncharacterized integral membrane protein